MLLINLEPSEVNSMEAGRVAPWKADRVCVNDVEGISN